MADQLTLEWGVYPAQMPEAETVDEMIELALVRARDFAGLEPGTSVVLTGGAAHGHAGRHEPRHGARDPLTLSGCCAGSARARAPPSRA